MHYELLKMSFSEYNGTQRNTRFASSDEREATCVEVETFPF